MEKLEYVMYGWANYQFTGIQKGIQFLHGAMEYALANWDKPEFQQWVKTDKTVVLLNGGVSNDNYEYGMVGIMNKLTELNVPFEIFREPDINNAITNIATVVDSRIWNTRLYMTYEEYSKKHISEGVTYWGGMAEVDKFSSYIEYYSQFFGGDTKKAKEAHEIRSFIKSFNLA